MVRTGVAIQPFQTPPMARPRFHSHTESLRSPHGALQSFNLLPVKDTNGRSGKLAIDEDDIIPVKETTAPLSPASSTTSTVSSASTVKEKDVVIADKDFDDKLKSELLHHRAFFVLTLRPFSSHNDIVDSLFLRPSSDPARDSRRAQCPLQFGDTEYDADPADGQLADGHYHQQHDEQYC